MGKAFRKPCVIGRQKLHNLNNKQHKIKKNYNNKTKIVIGASLFRKKGGCIIPIMNCYSRKR